MSQAARVSDFHSCPLVTAGAPAIPHVGGPIAGPGSATVLVGGLPAARAGDTAVCAGPPDVITNGSGTVLIEGRPAARVGDVTAHGGTIVTGCASVLIG